MATVEVASLVRESTTAASEAKNGTREGICIQWVVVAQSEALDGVRRRRTAVGHEGEEVVEVPRWERGEHEHE